MLSCGQVTSTHALFSSFSVLEHTTVGAPVVAAGVSVSDADFWPAQDKEELRDLGAFFDDVLDGLEFLCGLKVFRIKCLL